MDYIKQYLHTPHLGFPWEASTTSNISWPDFRISTSRQCQRAWNDDGKGNNMKQRNKQDIFKMTLLSQVQRLLCLKLDGLRGDSEVIERWRRGEEEVDLVVLFQGSGTMLFLPQAQDCSCVWRGGISTRLVPFDNAAWQKQQTIGIRMARWDCQAMAWNSGWYSAEPCAMQEISEFLKSLANLRLEISITFGRC